MPDLSYAFENMLGASFPFSRTPNIRVYFNAPVSITTVKLQPTFKNRTTNVAKYNITYINLDGTPYVDPKSGNILKFISTATDSTLPIQHEFVHNVKGFNLTILETNGGMPAWFRLLVLGCHKPSKCSYWFSIIKFTVQIPHYFRSNFYHSTTGYNTNNQTQ